MLETLHKHLENSELHILVRKGNESLFKDHPYLTSVLVWEKSKGKYNSLISVLKTIRKSKFDRVINAQRFASSGIFTALSGAKTKIGFDKNPLTFLFTKTVKHSFDGRHEIERNHDLLEPILPPNTPVEKPRLYPSPNDFSRVSEFQNKTFRCIAPTSVWFTKQWPKEKWADLINLIPAEETIYLLGAKADLAPCSEIKSLANRGNVKILAGELNLLESAALMSKASMNYVNDSAPMHLASAMNAPTTVIFCSTVPSFGFGPLSDNQKLAETAEKLDCRPCGVHGRSKCPQGHFKCASTIKPESVL
jgi:ADP-heptose:LPS heptosyltransferase